MTLASLMDKERKTPPKTYYQDPYKNIGEGQGLVRLGLNLNL
jgi:hypothetical protein